ncbi:hypothetical protein ACO0LB_12095 [Undibacterium sp. SXout7W]|uniref:hypothetical protein n=1 Tax=Undibacterium sp. SXout7W TaxID=3413049 RepID=UPI003BF23C39
MSNTSAVDVSIHAVSPALILEASISVGVVIAMGGVTAALMAEAEADVGVDVEDDAGLVPGPVKGASAALSLTMGVETAGLS